MPDLIPVLEDLTLSLWPALSTLYRDGWVIRLAGGHTGRANSVTVLGPGHEPLADKVAYAEAVYARAGLAPLFRITPLAGPELGALLDARGYDRHKQSHVMVLDRLPERALEEVAFDPRPDAAWNQAYAAMAGLTAHAARLQERIQAAIAAPCLYASVRREGRIASLALIAVDRGWAGVFEVATHPDFRGQGLAAMVVEAGLAKARRLGAERAFLQVQADNARAIPVYQRLGFATIYDYHYRKPATGPANGPGGGK
jgi:ribosomal protein S18 acetylase RimI-like enzyme